jgi:hypothetical protein
MAKYIDSGSGQADQVVGHWLESNALAGIREFRCQFGYFRYSAIEPFADVLRDLAEAGGQVHFVLGTNFGSLVAADAQRVLRVATGANASFSIVGFADAEFHPKTVHIVRADNSVTAVVGSSNLTARGLGQNVEAGVVFDSRYADPTDELDRIRDAIDWWRELRNAAGHVQAAQAVFPITRDDDLRVLAERGIINVPQPRRPQAGSGGEAGKVEIQLPRRSPTWRSARTGWRPNIPDLIEIPSNQEDPNEGESPFGPNATPYAPAPPAGTTPTARPVQEALLMRVRPRRDGTQLQISMRVHQGSFMNKADHVISAADGTRRPIGHDFVSRNEERVANLARFEAPEMEAMANPVARFQWVKSAGDDTAKVLQYEIFDADLGGEGAKIYAALSEGISVPPVTNLQSLSREITVLSKSTRAIAQWYRMTFV